MESLLHTGLSNAAVATVLALLAGVVGYFCRRPALVHSLWLLVLLKLVTPPLHSIPIAWPAPAEPAPAGVEADEQPVVCPVVAEWAEIANAQPFAEQAEEPPVPPELAEQAMIPSVVAGALETVETDALTVTPAPARAASLWSVSWQALVATAWLSGSVLWLTLTALRTFRFQRLLGHAKLAPSSLQKQAQRLAARLGLTHCPEVWLMPGRISPLLWAVGGAPRLFLPAGLWDRLDEEQRATLLVHELAHLRRRDHWVRGLELLVTGLYWWHPVVWLGRRALREAEEQCCDAWVVWALPRAAKAYAIALVETVDFLSEARTALPLAASGVGHVYDLRRRLTMIMNGTTPQRLTWAGFLAVLGLATVGLPVLPTWAQAPAEGGTVRARVAEDNKLDPAKKEEMQRARAEVEKLRAEFDAARAQLEATQARLRKAADRLAGMEGGHGDKIIIEIRGSDGKVRRLEHVDMDVIRRLEGGVEPARTVPTPRAGVSGAPPAMGGGPLPPQDRRILELEKKLDTLIKEMENLRRELRPQRPGDRPGGGQGAGQNPYGAWSGEFNKKVPGPGGDNERRIITITIPEGANLEEYLKKMTPEMRKLFPGQDRQPAPPPGQPRPPRGPNEANQIDEERKTAEKQLEIAMSRIQDLEAKLHALAHQDPRTQADNKLGRNPPAEKLEGAVKAIDASSGLVVISIGSDSGLSQGHTLEVYRLGPSPKYLGTLKIIKVTPTEAVGQPVQKLASPLEVGDRVSSLASSAR